jgi:nucleoid DNA-binding protein
VQGPVPVDIAEPLVMPCDNPMPNLTKRDLVISIAEKTGLIQQEVFSVIQHTLDSITEALATGRGVELRDFGVFKTRPTKQRVGRNPKKPDQQVVIPPVRSRAESHQHTFSVPIGANKNRKT